MMKKFFFALSLLFLCNTLSGVAQDLIVKIDATQIKAKVMEITSDAVRYKRFSNPDGPTYVLSVAEIDYIRYVNGEVDRFKKSAPAQTPIPTAEKQPASVEQPAPTKQSATRAEKKTPPTPAQKSDAGEYVLRRYKVGEYYSRDGVEGIICSVTEDGLHGTIISLDEIYLPWSEFRKPNLRVIGANNSMDGRANMEIVAAYIAANKLKWEDFPAFKWCRDKGEGWYLPAIDEVLTLGNNYNGGTRSRVDRQMRNKFNDTAKAHGGQRMSRMVYYFSSTEKDEKSAYTSYMEIDPPFVIEIPKYNKFLVRAMYRF